MNDSIDTLDCDIESAGLSVQPVVNIHISSALHRDEYKHSLR